MAFVIGLVDAEEMEFLAGGGYDLVPLPPCELEEPPQGYEWVTVFVDCDVAELLCSCQKSDKCCRGRRAALV